ncbi:hypothetical protein Rt10032_c23g6646 [Rhodotorula toruloides]|uniref:Uncharacterized protein n=1 Tax=Rhodotorula toruloides TaxID=5286 RepID=A0A511KQI5_RHOTO|nr:hypothetical protein Rt10032_c23g6646 [Rhodotorula toruloides]
MPTSTTLATTALALLVAARAALAATSIQSPALYQCTPAAFQYQCDAPPCTIVARPSNDPTSMIAAIGTVNDASGSISWRPNVAVGQQVTVYITDNNGAVGNNSPTTVAAGTSDSCLSGSGGASSSASSAASGANSAASAASGAAASASSSVASATSSLSSRVNSAVASASSAAASISSKAMSTASGASSSASSAAASASSTADKGSGAASIAINGVLVVVAALAVARLS